MNNGNIIAYFSMEIGIESDMPTYSGGLGVLAGDTIQSAANLQIPIVAITLLYRKGYFFQELDEAGNQKEIPVEWPVDDYLEKCSSKVTVNLEGREVQIGAWKYEMKGPGASIVPIYFLDANLSENSEWDRTLTDSLYGGDLHYRFCQEVILGIGGVRMLRTLGYQEIHRFHMNEGHAALLVFELIEEHLLKTGNDKLSVEDKQDIHDQCVFTTHTPVPAGHDRFSLELVTKVLGNHRALAFQQDYLHEDMLNMTYLALNFSNYINGVAKKHQEVSAHMFAKYKIDAITNGVSVCRWTAEPFRSLFDEFIPGWQTDNFSLRYALNIPRKAIWEAHMTAKRHFIHQVNRLTNTGLDADVFTIGFGRRAASYKRADLIFTDLDRLNLISGKTGKIQLVFAGKAHPQDEEGKRIIRHIFELSKKLKSNIKLAYLSNYDIEIAQMMVAGVDLWLNTPIPPMEASGTSGMKAAINGVPSFSILDGWWIEGCIEGRTGWAIGDPGRHTSHAAAAQDDADSLYHKMEQIILPMFYHDSYQYIDVMRSAIALNGSFFNTQRMMQQYVMKAYY
ncbi:alpha-glucan family phosphorylase [bacterium]